MSYQPRHEIAYSYYHVGTRGNNKRPIFEDSADRDLFVRTLSRIARKYQWHVFAHCLMTNHYHLVIQIAEQGLAKGMCQLNTRHALLYNARHVRTNHLFGRRYWSALIKSDDQLLAATRYVLQNPVRAGLVSRCEEWEWSSARATFGIVPAPSFLAVDELLAINETGPREARAERFRTWCNTSVPKRPRSSSQVW